MAIEPRKYETLYLLRPDISPEDLLTIQNRVEQSVTGNGGEMIKSEKWAERDLAYRIDNYTRGTYYIAVYAAEPKAVTDIERYFNLSKNNVLRFMTVKYIEEEQKPAGAAGNIPPRPSGQEDQSAFQTPPVAPEEKAEAGGEPSGEAAEEVQQSDEPPQEAAEEVQQSDEPPQEAAEEVQQSDEPPQEAAEEAQQSDEPSQEAAEEVQQSDEPPQETAEEVQQDDEPPQEAAEEPQGDEEKTQGGDQS